MAQLDHQVYIEYNDMRVRLAEQHAINKDLHQLNDELMTEVTIRKERQEWVVKHRDQLIDDMRDLRNENNMLRDQIGRLAHWNERQAITIDACWATMAQVGELVAR